MGGPSAPPTTAERQKAAPTVGLQIERQTALATAQYTGGTLVYRVPDLAVYPDPRYQGYPPISGYTLILGYTLISGYFCRGARKRKGGRGGA